ncbi:cytosolic sulfotransferase 15-like [Pistacia vera]|uniref:Uncharacterized protein n=1 Tax=Pistacia atlantica TaxID=434234 RepID=A0ACC1BUH9_9ROSI|nr:cytosolic sulfotransferase 15-like [Pistacia vera]KAJ0102643.1 hypothetical protein Patl1_04825 [Pistacia atlantica]
MEKSCVSQNPLVELEEQKKNDELISSLPRVELWDGYYLHQYQGFWCPSPFIRPMISFQRHFQAQNEDIILSTYPKSGAIWLKALIFTIVNRSRHTLEQSPLHTNFAHQLIPFFETAIYMNNRTPDLEDLPKPRIFATHAPYSSLPHSIIDSNCRIVYLCRNPLDQFISEWQFLLGIQGNKGKQRSMDEALEMACSGVQSYGPIWEHVLGYWKVSNEQPNKILFLKYEDLKEDTDFYVKKLADFLGYPFSKEEEKEGVIEEISKFCSFDNMKNLEASKTADRHPIGYTTKMFFRKGKLGDWKDYLTPSMAERLEKLMEEKFDGSGLNFKTS